MPAPKLLAHRIPPPAITLIIAVAMFGLAQITPTLTLAQSIRWPLAAGLFALGIAIELVAFFSFRRARTTINPLRPETSSQLVTAGIYQYSRNPMYVGMCCQLAAVAVFLAAPASLLGIVVFIALINWLQIAPEEKALDARFGASYQAYRASVRRWL